MWEIILTQQRYIQIQIQKYFLIIQTIWEIFLLNQLCNFPWFQFIFKSVMHLIIQSQNKISLPEYFRMRNQSNYDNTDASLKDKLISEMKKQLYQLKELDHEYLKLVDEVKIIQSKYSLLQDDGQRMDNEYKIKSDITRTNISQLRNQLDNIKIQIHKYNVNIDEIMREIGNFNRIIENRENEIASQMAINQEYEKNNEDQIQINKNLNSRIQNMKEERNKCQLECERLRKMLEDNINALKNLEKEARHIESSNQRHETILQIAMADRDELIQGLKSREQLVQNTNLKLSELQKERDQLRDRTNKLEKQCIKSESDLKQITSDLESGINRNKQLANKLKNQQKVLRNAQGELDQSLLQRQALVKQNTALSAEHNSLNSQIDKVLLTIMEMQKFNEDLQKEIKHFIDCDEEARKMLNRKQPMSKMLEQVLNNLHKSGEEIAHLR